MIVNSVKSLLVLALFSTFFFMGCKDDVIIDPEPTLPFDNLDEFFDTKAAQKQTFSIDPTTTKTITGAKGTKLTFYANSFVDAQGNAITGTVDFEMKEIYAKGDMIWSNRMTMASNGQLLESGGEFFLSATSGGQEVFLNRDYKMEVPVSSATSNPNAMDLFVANESDSTWTPADSTAWVGVDSSGGNYNVYFDSLTWINCDYFYNAAQTTQINVEPRITGVSMTDVSAYIVFDNINAVANLWYDSSTNTFSISGMPVGQSATIVIIGMDGTQLYLGTLSTVLNNNTTLFVPMSPVTQAQLTTTIDNL
ncbi:hypothetical protein [Aureispira anguillae]|uniref:Uncharacterized protein n=1 Tax=Aureispira anguillae TaxID=2864201 RepID=A0A916DTC4_9BACT|nr:hypothetical protein [Aureispira anguillae]BDS11366.1 hypothetical protein AsAng_0020780 [Aureispira anguillae]